jgi:hypothetical protein
MNPGFYNITAKQGATWRLRLNWRDGTGAQVNLAGSRARLVVRAKPGSGVAVLDLDSQGVSPAIVLGASDYNIVATVNKVTMGAIKPFGYVWDLEITDSLGDDWPLLTGRFDLVGSTVR